MRVRLEYNLYSEKGDCNSDRSRRCWLLAALIYLHTIIATPSGWSLLPKMEAHLIEELRELLEGMLEEPSGNPGFDPDVHLWILLFGGVHAREHEAAWYAEIIGDYCEREELLDWECVKVLVRNLPWVNEDVEEIVRSFWVSCCNL